MRNAISRDSRCDISFCMREMQYHGYCQVILHFARVLAILKLLVIDRMGSISSLLASDAICYCRFYKMQN